MYPVQLSIDHKDCYYYMWKIKKYEGHKIKISTKSNDISWEFSSLEYYTGVLWRQKKKTTKNNP